MRAIVGLAMLCSVAAIEIGALSPVEAATGDRLALDGTNVNVRSVPGLEGEIVATINPGETIIEVDRRDEWYFVTLPDRNGRGWIYAPLVKPAANAPAPAPQIPSTDSSSYADVTTTGLGTGVGTGLATGAETQTQTAAPAAPAVTAPRAAEPRATEPRPSVGAVVAARRADLEPPVRTRPARDPRPDVAVTTTYLDGDPKAGEQVFYKCGSCHTLVPGIHGDGPSLYGIVGSRPAGFGDFGYSTSMRAFAAEGNVWNEETLDRFIQRPKRLVPGTSMPFSGVRSPQDRKNLIAFLEQASR